MSTKSEKKINGIKKNHLWVPFVTFLIVTVILTITVVVSVRSMFEYVARTKIEAQCKEVYQLSRVAGSAGDIEKVFKDAEAEYVIKDQAGNILKSTVEDTSAGDPVLISFDKDRKAEVYSDSKYRFISFNGDDDFSVDYIGIIKLLSKEKEENKELFVTDKTGFFADETDLDNEEEASGEIDFSKMILPFWIKADTGGERIYLIKAYYELTVNDIAIIAVIFAVFILVTILVSVIMLVNLVNSIVKRKNTLRLFFTDIATKGHNWIWFQINSEKILASRKNASRDYACVNLVLMNYNNYCICNSVSAGEQLLERINKKILSLIGKNELCAYSNTANFALLLEYEYVSELEKRLGRIMTTLSLMDESHNLRFQAGADFIDAATDKKSRIARKETDINVIYSNACAARESLDTAKENACAFFDDRLIEDQKWINSVTEHQKGAVEKEEFVVYYQPKYDPVTSELKGAEALIRWQSPEFGFVPPGKFIPIFEKNGFITEIDHYMLSHVARDQKKWLDEGLKCVPVSVNVSRAHFIEKDLAEQIRDMVDEAGAPRELIEIELTESAFFDDQKQIIETIEKLKNYGFSVSMDDFGSGYSSLNSLKDMPLDVLKLDAEFFRGEKGERGEIVVSEAIKLAKRLDMRIVAEGVEEKEQVDFLASQNCDMIQGYYFAKPMPVADYEVRLKEGVARRDQIVHGEL